MKKKVYMWCAIGFAVAFLIIVGIMIRNAIIKKQANDTYEDMVETEVVPPKPEEPEPVEDTPKVAIPQLEIDWDGLAEQNGDIYAWIYIPDTAINYPVLQHPTEDDYYLMRNLDQSSGYPGCIYTQTMNTRDFTDFNTVLYGHNMRDGSMFAGVHDFQDAAYFESHPYIFIYTREKAYAYRVFGCYQFSDEHLLLSYDTSTVEGRQSYIDAINSVRDMNAHFNSDVLLDTNSKLITLSTCISGQADQRLLLQGVLVE